MIACGLGLAQLYAAQPAEDAFILFKYVENVAHGHGIVYYVGGPRTEGATDFLWMMLLAASVSAGADVAVAAVVWNALGAAVAAALLEREIARSGVGGSWRRGLLVVPLAVPFVAGAPAAYLGFSSLLYQAMILATFVATVDETGRFAATVPWSGLVLTLFRPDGAFFAAAFVLAAGKRAFRTPRWRSFVIATALAIAAGAIYFVARSLYFGELLPLPLHVKSHGVLHGPVADRIRQYLPWLSGIGVQLWWLKSSIGPLPLALAFVAILLVPPAVRGVPAGFWSCVGVAAFGSGLLLTALSFAFQAQNIHFRYQAPVVLLVLFVLAGLASHRIEASASASRRAVIFGLLLFGLVPTVVAGLRASLGSLYGQSYIDVLPARLASVLHPGRKIALTDAGRLAYWTDTPVIDVAGLNYAPTALRPPSVAELRDLDPDVLLIHPGAAIVDQTFPPDEDTPLFWEIGGERITQRIAPAERDVFDHGLERYGATSNTATIAAVVMLRYLAERAHEYEIEAVRYQGGYRHVFAFRRSLPEADAIRAALAESVSGRGYAPYAALKHFPLARTFDTELDAFAQ